MNQQHDVLITGIIAHDEHILAKCLDKDMKHIHVVKLTPGATQYKALCGHLLSVNKWSQRSSLTDVHCKHCNSEHMIVEEILPDVYRIWNHLNFKFTVACNEISPAPSLKTRQKIVRVLQEFTRLTKIYKG